MIGLYQDYADHRDKFEVIAIHDQSVKSFAELDEKLPKIKRQFWQGNDLPFPILLDTTGATEKLYGIHAHPTHLLIDPAGKLVGEVSAEELVAKLPPLPVAKVWAHQRDVQKNVMWSFVGNDRTPARMAEMFKRWTRCPVRVDEAALKACGLAPGEPLPGVLVGYPVTLRSIEDLFLAPHGLGIVPAADGKKLLITKRPALAEPPSYLQKLRAKELNERLDHGPTAAEQKQSKPLEIKDQTLLEAFKLVQREFELPIALDATAMQSGTLDPAAKVSGQIGPGELRQSLNKMIAPLALFVEVRSEAVVVTPRKK